ncbi:LysR family transcriptional regulator [soil metagenome]
MDRFAAMQTLVAVVESGSFSTAARRLGVGQPAVSKSVKQLESDLGTTLLLRSSSGLVPTEAGQGFYQHAKRALEAAEEASQSARTSATELSGRLRVASAITLARVHVVPRLQTFLDQHPALKLEIIMDDRIVDLREEGIDIALCMGNMSDSTMTARRIAHCRRVVVGTPEYLDRAGIPAVPSDLADHEVIVYAQQIGGASWTFVRGADEVPVVVSGRVSTTAAEGVRAGVMAGLGLGIASEWIFSPELKSGALVSVLDDWSLPPVDLWAVYPTGRLASIKARAFADFVEAVLDPGGLTPSAD